MSVMLEFTTPGSPRVVSRAIEEYARAQGNVTALVVPWESDATTLRMAVTSVKIDGWAIEHTNLGTITLTDMGHEATGVVITPGDPDHDEKQTLRALFDRFARLLQTRLADRTADGAGTQRGPG
jgi:hypothetical protein